MQSIVLSEVFDLLKQVRAVESEAEFIRDWLGRSECYMRTLRFKQAEPSAATLAICASKLHHYGHRMLANPNHRLMGERFLDLSEACHAEINRQGTATWLEGAQPEGCA